ncbi:FecCD family ABC transporter permease [Aureimonas pseudogalii]|uniref:Iron complex transport system permease protein n=1 Tax=Aureimonas pseudogalii TaxID=1744844 RepID=A0A7W6H7V2_9HYPH|nr:iron ABC transporter permease [Aureimonas pseudogalii]MBB4000239.1 iron complex transport system permease protein [Aureimonas pseudogalii]
MLSADQPAAAAVRGRSALGVFALLLLLVGFLSICVGRFPVSPGTAFAILGSAWQDGTGGWTRMQETVVLHVRLPRVLLAALCGGGLSLCGAALQGVFRNPLVSPHILGVSSGASFGGALAILLGVGGIAMIGSAFAFGIGALVLVGLLSRAGGGTDTVGVVLTGVVVAALFSALVSLLIVLADPETSLPGIVFWLMGSFAAATDAKLALAAPALLAGGALLLVMRFRINVLSLGEDEARSLGLPVERDRWVVFLAVALVEATVVSFAGVIGWVGLVVPHAARFLVGPDHRLLLPASTLLGAAYLVAIDTLARTLTAAEIPLGVLTALVGAPVFALVLIRRQRQEAR